MVILTDGQENASQRYTLAEVRERVEHQTEKYDWSFIFLGQNIDAFSEGALIGVQRGDARAFVGSSASGGRGQRSAYAAASYAVSRKRAKAARGGSRTYDAEEQARMEEILRGGES